MTDTTAGAPASQRRMTRSHWTDWGKWLALISMTVDHVVRYALSNEMSWQFSWASSTIGRVALKLTELTSGEVAIVGESVDSAPTVMILLSCFEPT